MPLMKGKSDKAMEHNIKAELNADKPQKQALAIAYAVRRKAMKQKMAAGGMVPDEDMGENMDPIVEQDSQDNEMLDPMREPEHGAARMMKRTEVLRGKAMNHEDMPEPAEPKRHIMPSEPKSMAAAIMGRRMAKGGMVDELSIDENDHDPRDEFLTADMPADETGSEHPVPDDEDPRERRRSMLSGIMSGLSRRHMGK